jgi:hypothetical protein
MFIQKAVSAQNTWSDKFELRGDSHSRGLRGRCLVQIIQGSVNSTVTLRRYGPTGAVVGTQTFTAATSVVEVPVNGLYDIGVATGGFGTGAITITVEQ